MWHGLLVPLYVCGVALWCPCIASCILQGTLFFGAIFLTGKQFSQPESAFLAFCMLTIYILCAVIIFFVYKKKNIHVYGGKTPFSF